MAANLWGTLLRAATFGESHGPAVGCVIDGVPAGIPLPLDAVQAWLDRRRPGQNHLQSQRREPDQLRVLSGLYQGRTLGTPLTLVVDNSDPKSADYAAVAEAFRPSHGDLGWHARHGFRDPRGGGRSSARETVARVMAGAVAEAVLQAWAQARELPAIDVVAWAEAIGGVTANGPPAWQIGGLEPTGQFAFDPLVLTRHAVDQSPVRCPDPLASAQMVAAIEAAQRDRDSVGGIVRCAARHVPAGLGEPVFGKLTATIGGAVLSLPACRGVQFGSGFAAAAMRGSAHNDPFAGDGLPWRTQTNHHGGTLGGISSGMPIVFDAAFKPAATIPQDQQGTDAAGQAVTLRVTGRHDPCVVPRAVPIVEATALFCIADAVLQAESQRFR